MPSFTAQAFADSLDSHLPRAFAGKLCIAFSGGLDSTVLLHVLAELRAIHPEWQLRAIHIDHQLQAMSGEWAEHCKDVAATLGVAMTVECVVIARDDSQGLEAAARNARHAVFRHELQHGEVLVTAHHADDQAETMLLALKRGSGVQGLAAMPVLKHFANGWHLRPLLPFSRSDLSSWAQERGIEAIDDPSNALLRHDRNYLRHQVLPALRKRWPTMVSSIGRSAAHLGEALELLEEVAAADLRLCAVERCLKIESLRSLSAARRRNLLRYWLRLRGLPLPSTRKLSGLEHDLFNTDLDRMPCVTWQDAELHWHRGLLYADVPSSPLSATTKREWHWHEPYILPTQLGQLTLTPTLGPGLAAARLPEHLTVGFRSGGEKIRLAGRVHRHALRNLFQERNVLPWWRDRLPLIYSGTQLLAVGDLFLSDDFAAAPGEVALQVVWEGAPEWKGVDDDVELVRDDLVKGD